MDSHDVDSITAIVSHVFANCVHIVCDHELSCSATLALQVAERRNILVHAASRSTNLPMLENSTATLSQLAHTHTHTASPTGSCVMMSSFRLLPANRERVGAAPPGPTETLEGAEARTAISLSMIFCEINADDDENAGEGIEVEKVAPLETSVTGAGAQMLRRSQRPMSVLSTFT